MGDNLSSQGGIKDCTGSRLSNKVILVLKGMFSQTENKNKQKHLFLYKEQVKNVEETLALSSDFILVAYKIFLKLH